MKDEGRGMIQLLYNDIENELLKNTPENEKWEEIEHFIFRYCMCAKLVSYENWKIEIGDYVIDYRCFFDYAIEAIKKQVLQVAYELQVPFELVENCFVWVDHE